MSNAITEKAIAAMARIIIDAAPIDSFFNHGKNNVKALYESMINIYRNMLFIIFSKENIGYVEKSLD